MFVLYHLRPSTLSIVQAIQSPRLGIGFACLRSPLVVKTWTYPGSQSGRLGRAQSCAHHRRQSLPSWHDVAVLLRRQPAFSMYRMHVCRKRRYCGGTCKTLRQILKTTRINAIYGEISREVPTLYSVLSKNARDVKLLYTLVSKATELRFPTKKVNRQHSFRVRVITREVRSKMERVE